ncbi:uncharacterized protein LOC143034203 [Oratosquilla oratoria]|uniref:uncharacterized protein LOC143034203 n=1 Tax=Oratosquilla oratoria TaxID=337810 RepID=UPI003F75E4C8
MNYTAEVEYVGHVAYNFVAPVIISFGILSNLLNLVVLTRPTLRGPTFRYLKWLAVDNLLVCVVLLPFVLHSHVTPVPYLAAFYFAHIEVPLGNALIASSVYIVVGLSIDRFVAVCYPRKYRNLHSHYVASVRIAASFTTAFLIYTPMMAFYKHVEPSEEHPGRFLPKANQAVVTTRWWTAYEYLLEICVRFAPAVLLAVLNTWIIIEFKRISRRRQLMTKTGVEVSNFPSVSYVEATQPQAPPTANALHQELHRGTLSELEENTSPPEGVPPGAVLSTSSSGAPLTGSPTLNHHSSPVTKTATTTAVTAVEASSPTKDCFYDGSSLNRKCRIGRSCELSSSKNNSRENWSPEQETRINNNNNISNNDDDDDNNTDETTSEPNASDGDAKSSTTKQDFKFIDHKTGKENGTADGTCLAYDEPNALTTISEALDGQECETSEKKVTENGVSIPLVMFREKMGPERIQAGDLNGLTSDVGMRNTIGLSMVALKDPAAPTSPSPTPVALPGVRRCVSERRHDMERRLVLLLVSIIVAFFITNIPSAILSLTFSDDKRQDFHYQVFRAIANNLEFLNFGLNFVLYFLFSKDIRNVFVTLVRRAADNLNEKLEGSSSKYVTANL